MNKRGQIYLLASIIIGLVIFVLASKTNIINTALQNNDFKEITQNYNSESAKSVSSLIKEGKNENDIALKFAEFSVVFTQYSKTKNPSFGLIYFFNYNNNLHIGNFLDQNVKVFTSNENLNDPNSGIFLVGCFSIVSSSLDYNQFQISMPQNAATFYGENGRPSTSVYGPCTKRISPAPSYVNLQIGDESIDYKVDIIQNQPQVAVISRESLSQDRKVFVDHQFIRGNRHTNNNQNSGSNNGNHNQ